MQPLTISCVALYHEQEQPESINKDKAPATKISPSMHLGSTHYRNGGTEEFPTLTKGRLGGKHCLPRSTLSRGFNQEAQRWGCRKGRFSLIFEQSNHRRIHSLFLWIASPQVEVDA
jgi:hypothetical protein